MTEDDTFLTLKRSSFDDVSIEWTRFCYKNGIPNKKDRDKFFDEYSWTWSVYIDFYEKRYPGTRKARNKDKWRKGIGQIED